MLHFEYGKTPYETDVKDMNINVHDTEAIEAALDAVQSRARERWLGVEDIVDAAEDAESRLDALMIRKADRVGMKILVHPVTGAKPGSYNYSWQMTTATLLRRGAGWRVVDVDRGVANTTAVPWRPLQHVSDEALLRGAQRVLNSI